MSGPDYTVLGSDGTTTNPALTENILSNFNGMLGLAPSVLPGALNAEFHAFDDRFERPEKRFSSTQVAVVSAEIHYTPPLASVALSEYDSILLLCRSNATQLRIPRAC